MTRPSTAGPESPGRMRDLLVDRLASHFEGHLRPRLAGMSDEE